jgi:four helix bundle protein
MIAIDTGISAAADADMKFEKIQDFEVWTKAATFSDAVTAILTRLAFGKNSNLLRQIETAVDSITANMSEGFDQPTDRGFANYLFTAKGSVAEVCARLTRASRRGCLTTNELEAFQRQADEVGRMLTGLIKHLMKTPNRRRGLGALTSGSRQSRD